MRDYINETYLSKIEQQEEIAFTDIISNAKSMHFNQLNCRKAIIESN